MFDGVNVLEMGSMNLNGSIRDLFTNCDYIGLDVAPGKDVDVVCEGQKYDGASNSFDTTISCECFEHNPYWADTFKNMIRLTKPGGLIVFTCATAGREKHGTLTHHPEACTATLHWNYYMNVTEKMVRREVNIEDNFVEHQFTVNNQSHDLYFWGVNR